MKKSHQVTMKEIAKKLQVSVSTVSRALKDSPELHPETKQKIVAMAKEMNYQPNLLAQSLRSSRSKVLGVIVPELTSHFFSSNISGIQDTAYKRGYNIMICQSNERYDMEVANVKTLVSSQVDGLLISLSRETKQLGHLQELYDRQYPFVLFDRVSEMLPVTQVIVDDAGGAYEVVKHLLEQGCRKVVFVSGPEELYISKKRREGYEKALREFSIPLQEDLIYVSDMTPEGSREVAAKLMERKGEFDGIFAMIDPMAVEIMMQFKAAGIAIPKEVAVAGFTNNPTAAVVEPSLTTVSQPGYEMGVLAAECLLDQLSGDAEEEQPKRHVLQASLVERKSSQKRGA
ncbi:MAG: LacI family DNA-binding transcriptional regulator [Nitritalea sp.]